jgi:glycosyltransferase involved in cell wall biosynthesis
MAERPDLTFVIPNYNGAEYLRETLESLLAQRDGRFRLILADNCSTDGSVEIAHSYRDDRISVILADRHVSMSENWNRAMGYVDTPFFVLAHADDLYDTEYVSVLLPLLRERPNAFVAHCMVHNIDEQGTLLDLPVDAYKSHFYPPEDPYCRQPCDEAAWLRKGNYILAPSAMYRTELVQAIGVFNPRFQFVPDWEYWLRGVFAGRQIAGTRRKLVKYRRHASSLTRAAERNLSRYDEEIELLEWLAPAGHAAGCFANPSPDYALVSNTLMSEFTDRLARGDRDGAARLSAFARQRIPGFRASARDLAARAALPMGATGGRALAWGRARVLELLTWRRA